MKLLNRTVLLKQVASFAGIAGVSSLLSLPGLAQINPQLHSLNRSAQSFELAQGSSGNGSSTGGSSSSPSNGSSTGGSSSSPSNGSSTGGSSTPSNTSGGSSNSPSNSDGSGGSSTPSTQSGEPSNSPSSRPDRTNTPSNNSGGSSTSPNTGNTENSLSSQDRTFVNQAAQMGMLEVQLGQMAVQRGSSNTVKQYGQRMVNEHTQANRQLLQLASQKGVTPTTELSNEYKTRMQRLSQLSGSEFDEAYMREMVNSHNQAIALFQTQAQRGQDPELKAWASQLVPNLQAHLQLANQVAQQTRTR